MQATISRSSSPRTPTNRQRHCYPSIPLPVLLHLLPPLCVPMTLALQCKVHCSTQPQHHAPGESSRPGRWAHIGAQRRLHPAHPTALPSSTAVAAPGRLELPGTPETLVNRYNQVGSGPLPMACRTCRHRAPPGPLLHRTRRGEAQQPTFGRRPPTRKPDNPMGVSPTPRPPPAAHVPAAAGHGREDGVEAHGQSL